MNRIVVSQDCIDFDEGRFNEMKLVLNGEVGKKKVSELLDVETFLGQKMLKNLSSGESFSKPDVSITNTIYTKRRFYVYNPPNRQPMMIRRPCTVQGKRVKYLDMIDCFETLADFYRISDRHLVDLIIYFDRYVPDTACDDCLDGHTAWIATQEIDPEKITKEGEQLIDMTIPS